MFFHFFDINFRWDGLFEGKECIYKVYKDAESIKVDKADPIVLVLTSYCTYTIVSVIDLT